ncbi:MAG: class II aldolase/adducin family protein [Euryarchaeota archaeon]
MARKKTSVEQTREQEKLAQVGNMLDAAFGDVGGLQVAPEEEELVVESAAEPEPIEAPEADPVEVPAPEPIEEDVSEAEPTEAPEVSKTPPPGPSGPPSGPPSNPPSGPPSGSPSNPPSGPPSGPSSPPSGGPPSSPSSPPSGGPPSSPSSPPSGGPPSGPSSEPVMENEDLVDDPVEEETVVEEDSAPEIEVPEVVSEPEEAAEIHPAVEEESKEALPEPVAIETTVEPDVKIPIQAPVPSPNRTSAAEAEVARLSAEVARLRQSMAGATEVIEGLETPPMPPAVLKDIVIDAHIVSDFARLARQLDREQLIRATMGTIAMLHPDQPGVMISTRNMAMLPRLDERGLCAAPLGGEAPQFAPEDWRLLEVVLASASLATGGPAAVIHSHGAYTTAASCEKDLVVVSPIDEIGKRSIGKVIIVDPDDENPDDFLRQIAEALQQGGMRCVVVRGRGAYAVGRDLDQAWANAAMVEHSMRIVLLARQANLKI